VSDTSPEATAVLKSREDLDLVIATAFKDHLLILASINERLDRIDSVATKALWERL